MDWGLVITTILGIINIIVLSVGGALTVAKVKHIADTNTSDVKEIKQEIKEGFARIEKKMDSHLDITHDHGRKIASLETQLKHAAGRR